MIHIAPSTIFLATSIGSDQLLVDINPPSVSTASENTPARIHIRRNKLAMKAAASATSAVHISWPRKALPIIAAAGIAESRFAPNAAPAASCAEGQCREIHWEIA